MTDETPLTDEELDAWATKGPGTEPANREALTPYARANRETALRLVAEVRRLRAALRDGNWVEVAADEIARWCEWSDSEVGDKIEATQAEIDSWQSSTDADVVTAIIRRQIAERVPDPLCPTCGRQFRWREGPVSDFGDRTGSWACVKGCAPDL